MTNARACAWGPSEEALSCETPGSEGLAPWLSTSGLRQALESCGPRVRSGSRYGPGAIEALVLCWAAADAVWLHDETDSRPPPSICE